MPDVDPAIVKLADDIDYELELAAVRAVKASRVSRVAVLYVKLTHFMNDVACKYGYSAIPPEDSTNGER